MFLSSTRPSTTFSWLLSSQMQNQKLIKLQNYFSRKDHNNQKTKLNISLNYEISRTKVKPQSDSLIILKHLTTPSPPPIASISPELLKSVEYTALLRSVIVTAGQNKLRPSKIFASLATAPPATIKSPVVFKNWVEYT